MSLKASPRSRRRHALAVLAAGAVAAISLLQVPPVTALPPSGANTADTPGTSSSVSPKTLAPCETLNFQVTGFPAGEVVYVKIDDGQGYGDQSIQGAGVVATQRVDSSGRASGSVQIPCDMDEGSHWLRYLASEPMDDAAGGGVLGYSNKGNSTFNVKKKQQETTQAAAPVRNNTTQAAATPAAAATSAARANSAGSNTRGGTAATTVARAATGNTGGQAVNQAVAAPANAAAAGAANAANAGNAGNTAVTANAANTGTDNTSDTAADAAIGPDGQAVSADEGIFGGILDDAQTGTGADAGTTVNGETLTTASQSQSNSIPWIGLFIGGAILLVGMTAINTWLFVQRRPAYATQAAQGNTRNSNHTADDWQDTAVHPTLDDQR